jgi:hypothetical protein
MRKRLAKSVGTSPAQLRELGGGVNNKEYGGYAKRTNQVLGASLLYRLPACDEVRTRRKDKASPGAGWVSAMGVGLRLLRFLIELRQEESR